MNDHNADPNADSSEQNDDIIGVAFKWSVVAIVPILALCAILYFAFGRTAPVVEEIITKDAGAIDSLVVEKESRPDVVFTDIAESAGITFVHRDGSSGEKLLPETMIGGAAFMDYDNDGDQDILLVSGTEWPHADPPANRPSSIALYENDGAGNYRDVTEHAGLATQVYGMGVACADIDGDGDTDLFIAAVGGNLLYENIDGTFTDITDRAGVAGGLSAWSSSAGFFDMDADGDLDLFVCNYIEWSREIDIELNYTLNGTDRAYGPPTNYRGTHCSLFRNDGNGVFTDVSARAGIHVNNPATGVPVGKALALAIYDFDGDGDEDIAVANDTVQNFLFRNNGDGTFEETGSAQGIAYDSNGKSTGAMGIDVARYRNNESIAVGIGNFANEMTSFYVLQNGIFTDEAIGEGIGSPTRARLSFGLFFFDYDLDGRLDLLQANGHLEEEITQIQPSQHYKQPAQLFWNRGPDARSAYAEVPQESTGELSSPIVGRGAAYADIDGDGDLDVLLTAVNRRPLLLRNDQQTGNNWVRITLQDPTTANHDAIGATITLTSDGIAQERTVMPTRSYLSQVERTATFGLGISDSIDEIRIRWPDGGETRIDSLALNRAHTIVRARPE